MKPFLALLVLSIPVMAQPVVTAVVDAGAYTSNIAQGSIFVVRGTGLAPAGLVEAPAPMYPTSLNTVRISMTAVAGGAVVTPLMVHTYNVNGAHQLAALLPSSAAVGAYDLRVDIGGVTSAPFRTSVAARKPGLVTVNSAGTGPAVATLSGGFILQRTANQGKIGQYDTRSAHPGERVDLWGTGIGPDSSSDTGGTSGDQTVAAAIRVLVNGTEVTPLYAGRSFGLPGLDQIVFTLPAGVALNCTVDIQVRAGGVLSNPVTIATSTGDACPATSTLRFNEAESSGGTPGDWVELFNSGPNPVNLAGFGFKDNDDSHVMYPLPATTLDAGAYLVLEEADFGFGLGASESARLFRPDGTLADSYTWTAHAATTYGRCPTVSGAFTTTTASTKGVANNCNPPVVINEVESSGGTPGDWVELLNQGPSPVDISGFVFRDNDDTHTYTIPAGTTIAAGGYLVLEEAALTFGLGAADNARLFDTTGKLVDSYDWTAHASTTYGRCPNGSGPFATTTASTKGVVNTCAGDVTFLAWPGGTTVAAVDTVAAFNGNLSGLVYEGAGNGPDVLWGARNGPGTLFRLIFNGVNWVPDASNSWGAGKSLRYPGGTGDTDAEGVTFAGTGSSGGLFVSTERDNTANSISKNSILRFDPAGVGTTLTATHEWNLTADLPVTGANLGMEGITWISDAFLVSKNFFDETKNHTYNPSEYPNHGTGLFFVGLEANGIIYAYALDQAGTVFNRVATIMSGQTGVMDLTFDRDLNDLWAVCDDTCQGRSVVLRIDATGRFKPARQFDRPTGMPNLNNEGFAIAPATQCVGNVKPVFWSDDSETGGHSIRSGTLTCLAF